GDIERAGQAVTVPPGADLRREHRADVLAEFEVAELRGDFPAVAAEGAGDGRADVDLPVAPPAAALKFEGVVFWIAGRRELSFDGERSARRLLAGAHFGVIDLRVAQNDLGQ